jgi:hypothetical protein
MSRVKHTDGFHRLTKIQLAVSPRDRSSLVRRSMNLQIMVETRKVACRSARDARVPGAVDGSGY